MAIELAEEERGKRKDLIGDGLRLPDRTGCLNVTTTTTTTKGSGWARTRRIQHPLYGQGALQTEKESALIVNPDQWDGYVANRDRLLNHIETIQESGVLVLAGDLHSSWASDLVYNLLNICLCIYI